MNFLDKFIKDLKHLKSFEYKAKKQNLNFVLINDVLCLDIDSNVPLSVFNKHEISNIIFEIMLEKKIDLKIEKFNFTKRIKELKSLYICDELINIEVEEVINIIYNTLLRNASSYNKIVFKKELSKFINSYCLKSEKDLKKDLFVKNLKI